ncbi:MAG: DNA primase [Ignavibacteriaceae bacterium]|nr:DNA primase [Ignavibacteriaceae bacterium]
MRIPDSKIEEIRQTANIVDLISEVVPLKRRGKNYIGLCPFHTEKTPSFTVSDEKQIYHCFGCHNGGNVFKFFMEYHKISFIEAVQELAQRLGIDLEFEGEQSSEKQSEQELLYDINTEAAKYFSNILLHDDEGEIARNYFQKRKIKTQTMRVFGLGYSISGWEHFLNFAKEKNIDLEKAENLGLIGRASDGRLHDKYSGRIIFPIFSPNGRVVGFAGRVIDERDKGAKYINSPENLIYNKSRILYGLSFSKDEIRRLDKAIIVEGYMDLISLYQAGIKNVVAVSGTALTEEQVQLLSRYTKNAVLLFDADTAGEKASMRSIELLLKRDFDVKIVSLPRGEDPDSFVNNYGKERFDELIIYAQNFLEYQTAYYESLGMFNDPSKMAEAVRELVKPIALIGDELKRTILIKTIAKKFNLREKLLESELANALVKAEKQIISEAKIRERDSEKTEKKIEESLELNGTSTLYNLEKEIIKLLYEGNGEINKMIMENLEIDEFYILAHRKLAEIVYEAALNNEDLKVSSLLEKIEDESLSQYVLEITFDKYSISKNWEKLNPTLKTEASLIKYTGDVIVNYKMQKIDLLIKNNLKKIEEAESEEESLALMRQNQMLEIEKRNIRKFIQTKNI